MECWSRNATWILRTVLLHLQFGSGSSTVPFTTRSISVLKQPLVYTYLNTFICSVSVVSIFVCELASGELKKMLSGPTGLHHQDQKLLYKNKERENKTFLDIVGVKDKSKIVLIEDPISQEKRYLEMRKNAKVEKAAKTISDISLEVDRLARQVSRDSQPFIIK